MMKTLQNLWVQAALTFVPLLIIGAFLLFTKEPIVRGTFIGELSFYTFWSAAVAAVVGWCINFWTNFVYKE